MRRLAARMIVIGIVGSPAGGKSTVAAHLQGLGATWVNADQVAREVLEREEIQKQLIGHFGTEITTSDGRIDRTQLAQSVFGDDDAHRAALNYLERVIHPPTRAVITQRLIQAADQGAVAAILDVPLLFETKWDRCCDEVWCVDACCDRRRQRAAARGWSDGELARREENQLAIAEKRRLSNWVIANDGSLRQLTDTIDQRWSSLLGKQAELTIDPRCPSVLR